MKGRGMRGSEHVTEKGESVTTTATKERPILMDAESVRAILDGSKVQTRRVVKPQPQPGSTWDEESGLIVFDGSRLGKIVSCPYGAPGDRLIPVVQWWENRRYAVGLDGHIYSQARGDWKRLKEAPTSNGYMSVSLSSGPTKATRGVHRMVCHAFHGPPDRADRQVRHLDGNPVNNSPENLAWGSQEDNWSDRNVHGRGNGEDHHNSKLTQSDVDYIRSCCDSQRSLAKYFGVSQSVISDIRNNRIWRTGCTPAPAPERWACRLVLEVKAVRVERVQEISTEDINAEGIVGDVSMNPVQALWINRWNSINPKHPWDSNPWVWVVEFERMEPAAEMAKDGVT